MSKFNRILITGATSGMGYAFLDHYTRLGKEVICVNRRHDPALVRDFPKATFEVLDISHHEQVEKLLIRLKHHDALPDLVILNAGINKMDNGAKGLNYSDFQEVMRVNLDGVMTFVSVLNMLGVKGKTIAVISSSANIVPNPRHVAYHLSKWAVHRAFELLRRTDRDNTYKSVVLGPVRTNIMRYSPKHQGMQKKVYDALVVEPHPAAQACLRFFEGKGSSLYYPLWVCAFYAFVRFVTSFFPKVYEGSAVTQSAADSPQVPQQTP